MGSLLVAELFAIPEEAYLTERVHHSVFGTNVRCPDKTLLMVEESVDMANEISKVFRDSRDI